MKFLDAFKTPPWEQKDAALRARAVRDGDAPELLAKLSQIAAQDPEPSVRRAALARLCVPAQLLERAGAESDPATREIALQRLARLLLDPAAGLAPGARLAAVALPLPGELLEKVAEQAPEPEARRAALARLTRPAWLARRCAEEADPALRAELLERIEGEEALDRLAEALRKRDKTLARRARERAEALRLARAEPGALARWADALCETLTQWARELPDDVETRVAEARSAFEARRADLLAAQQGRIEAYLERVREAGERQRARAAAPVPPAAPDAGPEATAPVLLQGEAGYPETVVPADTPSSAATDWSALDRALGDANRAAAAKHLGEARPALAQVQALLPGLPRLDRARRERLAQIEAHVAELEQWQRWSGNRVRARLCEELEALIAAAPHPDAVAHKVRELQQEWQKVEAAEPGEADRGSGLAKRFRALCARAMAPTKPYFEQRHALRAQRRAALEALLQEAAPETLGALAAPAAVALRRRLVEALRTLDELEPRARTALARRLREGLARVDAHLDAQREDAALARRKLIAKLRRELTHAAPVEALVLARDAQQQWKALPRASRAQEGALEQELRALIDPLFAREREQRDQAGAQARRQQAEARRVLDELEALAQGDAEALAHAEGRLAALTAGWRELQRAEDAAAPDAQRAARPDPGRRGARDGAGRRDERGGRDERRGPRATPVDAARRERERAFDQAVGRVRQAQAALEQVRREARMQALVDAFALFARAAADGRAADVHASAWDALPLDATDRARLAACWNAPVGADRAPERERAAEIWLVDAELELGLDSPPGAQSLRRERQMQRLAQRLQGGAAAAQTVVERLHALLALAPLDPAAHTARQERLARIVAAWARAAG